MLKTIEKVGNAAHCWDKDPFHAFTRDTDDNRNQVLFGNGDTGTRAATPQDIRTGGRTTAKFHRKLSISAKVSFFLDSQSCSQLCLRSRRSLRR